MQHSQHCAALSQHSPACLDVDANEGGMVKITHDTMIAVVKSGELIDAVQEAAVQELHLCMVVIQFVCWERRRLSV